MVLKLIRSFFIPWRTDQHISFLLSCCCILVNRVIEPTLSFEERFLDDQSRLSDSPIYVRGTESIVVDCLIAVGRYLHFLEMTPQTLGHYTGCIQYSCTYV